MPVPAFMCDTAAELLRAPEQPARHGETLPQKKTQRFKKPNLSPKQSQRINSSRQFFPYIEGKTWLASGGTCL